MAKGRAPSFLQLLPGTALQVYRVLKPGGTFIFIQRLSGGAPLQPLLGGTAGAVGEQLGACCCSQQEARALGMLLSDVLSVGMLLASDVVLSVGVLP